MARNPSLIGLVGHRRRCNIDRAVHWTLACTCILIGVGFTVNRYSQISNVRRQQPTLMVTRTNSTLPQDPLFGHNITLTFRMTSTLNLMRYLFCQCLPSVALFWSPKLGAIGLILDEESEKDHEFEDKLRRLKKNISLEINVHYEAPPRNRSILKVKKTSRDLAYNRQLWSSFLMDMYIDTSIIAWTDTDTIFTTPVTPENIFNSDGKLKVKSMNTRKRVSRNKNWNHTTYLAIGRGMPGDFMTYFPVYIWTDTITNCREYILEHKKTNNFEEAFSKLYRAELSPVNVILSYAYYFEYDRYDWHFDLGKETLEVYNKKQMEPDSPMKASDTSPDLHTMIHKKGEVEGYIERAYCQVRSHVGDLLPTECTQFNNTVNFQLFMFNPVKKLHNIKTWCKDKGRSVCVEMIESHYRNVVKYYKMGWYDLDTQKMHSIRQAARAMDVECPTIQI